MTMTEESADSGVKVVGATTTDDGDKDTSPRATARRGRERSAPAQPTRRSFRIVSVLAVVGLLGTLVFGILYATKSSGSGQNPAVTSAAQTFLDDFFNFNAKSVDTDFNAITDMATGQFSTQAKQFFNSSIRTELEQALAESRGQIRALYVQSETPTTATVYAVIDQTYVNNKITTPQADVVRLVVNLENVGGTWKISDVTVLEGASPASAGTASGSSGSNVPGQ
ncbi:MAG TPA: hypothetical protein VN886_24555 [Acidimicrobiales bacterium]|nr:hypothetical protein [Acidimicrobiales bacterium]